MKTTISRASGITGIGTDPKPPIQTGAAEGQFAPLPRCFFAEGARMGGFDYFIDTMLLAYCFL